MKSVLLFFYLIAGILQAQIPSNTLKSNGVYLSSEDFIDGKLTLPFNKVDSLKFKENNKLLLGVETAHTTFNFLYDEIWGYRKEGTDWRIFNDEFYQLNYEEKICIYTFPESPALYFSKSLTTPLHELTRKNLIAVYNSNAFFVEKINALPLTKSVYKWDRKKKRFQFIDWL